MENLDRRGGGGLNFFKSGNPDFFSKWCHPLMLYLVDHPHVHGTHHGHGGHGRGLHQLGACVCVCVCDGVAVSVCVGRECVYVCVLALI